MSGSAIPANAPYVRPDNTAQDAATYKARLDAAAFTFERMALWFAPSATSPASLKVQLKAGFLPAGTGALAAEIAAQQTAALTAPASNPRKDLVYIDNVTGAVGVAAGAESGAPVDPAVPAGKLLVARITWTVAAAAIANSMLEDIRSPYVMDPTTTRGDVIVRGASGLKRVPLGVAGTFLGSDGLDATFLPVASLTTSAQSGSFQAGQTDQVLYVVSDTAIVTAPDAEASGGSPTGVPVNFRFGVKNQTDGKDVTVKGYHILDTFDGLASDFGSPSVPITIRIPGRETVWFIKDAAGSWTIEKRPSWEVGDVKEWGTNTLPTGGWDWVNGQTANRVTLGGLFAVWGTSYGAGNGSTTFTKRDDRNRAKFGKGDMGGATDAGLITSTTFSPDGKTLGATGGAQTVTPTTATMPSHNHPGGDTTLASAGCAPGSVSGPLPGSGTNSTGLTGGGGALNKMNPGVITNFIVKT